MIKEAYTQYDLWSNMKRGIVPKSFWPTGLLLRENFSCKINTTYFIFWAFID